MNLEVTLYLFMLMNVYGNYHDRFIIDYFTYKKASAVVGFSCNTIEEDLTLLKGFSKTNIAVALNNLYNKAKIDLLAKTDYWKVGVFLDLRCYDKISCASIFADASESKIFDELHYWLVLGYDLSNVLRIIDDRAFGLTTDFIIAICSNGTNHYKLYDVYNMSKAHGGILNVTILGNWSRKVGLNITIKQSKFERRADLHNITIKATFFKFSEKPKNISFEKYVTDYVYANRDSMSKFGFHILSHLSNMYNFSLQPVESPDWEPTDLIGPLVRTLMNNTVDLTGTPLTMNIQRTYLVKFVHQDWPFRTCFIFRNPQLSDIKVQQILRPFSNNIWYLLIVFLILIIIILIIVLHYEKFNTGVSKFSNSVLITFGTLCQQGTTIQIERLSSRIAILFVLILGLLMYNYYSACIVSARLAEPIYKINDSLNELGKLRLKIGSEWMNYMEYFLRQSHWDAKIFYQKYWQTTPKSRRYFDPEIGMRMVQKGGFAYHTYPDVGYTFIKKYYDNREICELMEVHLIRPVHTPFAVTVNSSFVEIARVGLTKISEVGLRRRQVLRWSQTKPVCRKDIRSASSINIYEFLPVLILLIIGMALAITVLVIEIIFAHFGTLKFR